jgi:hypothetical protein
MVLGHMFEYFTFPLSMLLQKFTALLFHSSTIDIIQAERLMEAMNANFTCCCFRLNMWVNLNSLYRFIIIIIIIITYLLTYLLTAIGLSPGGSSPTLVQTKIKIHKTTITTKQLQNINIKQQNNYKTIKISTQTEQSKCKYYKNAHTHIKKHMKLKQP